MHAELSHSYPSPRPAQRVASSELEHAGTSACAVCVQRLS